MTEPAALTSSHQAMLDAIQTRFPTQRVLVVGDLMLDRYQWGRVQRVSPEAPVPVLELERETCSLGGAANVARNLATLGVQVSIAGVASADADGADLRAALETEGIDQRAVLSLGDRCTTVKTRIIGNHQQLLRIDHEHSTPLSEPDRRRLLTLIDQQLNDVDVMLLSDYAKGVLTGGLCELLIERARQCNVAVLADPKGKDFSRYAGATVLSPNRAELAVATGIDPRHTRALLDAAAALRASLNIELMLVTLGEAGIALLQASGEQQIPASAREVFDVSGAGDTVIALFAAGLSAGLGNRDSAELANLAAGLVVSRLGTAAVTGDELSQAVDQQAAEAHNAKLHTTAQLLPLLDDWRARGQRIVFTNGCFDLLHAGHASLLERARRYGDRLIVGLNSDRSVQGLKGPDRPIIAEQDRARVLAALAAVDAVILFEQDTPLQLILALHPDVLVKGSNYREQDIVGAQQVSDWGGQVALIPLIEDLSTTAIIERVSPSPDHTGRHTDGDDNKAP